MEELNAYSNPRKSDLEDVKSFIIFLIICRLTLLKSNEAIDVLDISFVDTFNLWRERERERAICCLLEGQQGLGKPMGFTSPRKS